MIQRTSRLISFALLLLAAGCGREDRSIRRYQEVHVAPPAPPSASPAAPAGMSGGAMTGAVPTSGQGLGWTKPAGWSEEPGNQVRLATFRIEGAEVSITAFPGATGSAEANLGRWLGQLKLDATAERLAQLVTKAEQGETSEGLTVTSYDFSVVLPADAPTSMLAAVVAFPDRTAFVKMTGPSAVLAREKAAFQALAASLKSAPEGNGP